MSATLQASRPMRGIRISAACVALLALAEIAHSNDNTSRRSPLTEAERANCQGQVEEINKSIAAHNSLVAEIKSLRTEIENVRKELDIQEASVDRNDGAAMEALNARIVKNNELIERHQKMSITIKAMADANSARITDFRAACENRSASAPETPMESSAQAPTTDSACKSAIGAKEVQHRIEATFAAMRTDQRQRESEVERVAAARASADKWSKEKQSKVWLNILSSPKFMAFEREKQPYVQELMRVVGSSPKNAQEECKLLQRIAATLPAIKAINARQYSFMADEIRSTK